MGLKVGIPRALFFYQYYPLWKTFLEELGAEVVVSGNTNKKIMDDGVGKCVDEACLPVKVYHGHVMDLKDRVDCLFIPRHTSISRNEYVCPKFGGLPDMVRNTLTGLPPIIDVEVNLRKSRANAMKAAMEAGSFFTGDAGKIKIAYRKAMAAYKNYRVKIKRGAFPGEVPGCLGKGPGTGGTADYDAGSNHLKIAVIGHSYNLYDDYVNMGIVLKLRKSGVNIITIDMIDDDVIREKSNLLNKKPFWYFGTRALGSIYHLLGMDDLDGIIYIMSFGCGIDSFICDLAERKTRREKNIPYMVLTIDEHSGEAGINTRLEAFTDMIRWRYCNESDFSTYGKPVYKCQGPI